MHPHPVSLLNPSRSARLRNRTVNDMAAEAFGSWDRGIGGKFERYVIHILVSKSSRKEDGQPPSEGSFDKDGLSPLTRAASSKLPLLTGGTEVGNSGDVELVVSDGAWESVDEAISTISSWSVVETGLGGGPDAYSWPKNQIGSPDISSFFGCGS